MEAQRALFPLLVVAYEAGPGATLVLGEGGGNIHIVRLQAEHLNHGAGLLLEEEAGVDDARVVEDQHGPLGQQRR